MKLIYCPYCRDVVRLKKEEMRSCQCGKVYGQYRFNGDDADISKNAIPLGIANGDIEAAAIRHPDKVTAVRMWVDKNASWHIIDDKKITKEE